MRISTTISFSPIMKKQATHWWQSAFSFASSSSNTKSTSDDTLVGSRYFLKPSFFSSRASRNSRTRGKKVRHFTETDVEAWPSTTPTSSEISPARFSSSSAALPSATPQPLPLPELQTLLRRDAKSASVKNSNFSNVPLPSPRDAQPRYSSADEKEKEKTEASNGTLHNEGAAVCNSVAR